MISLSTPAICRVFTKGFGQHLRFKPQNMSWGDLMPNRNCQKETNNKRKEISEAHIVEEKGESHKKPKGEDPKDLLLAL